MVERTQGSHHKVGTTKMEQSSTIVAGIDTGKAFLDVAMQDRPDGWRVTNDPPGWHQLAARFRDEGVGRVGIEASGGYERGVVAHLRAAGLQVVLHQPIQVRAFASMTLRRAKNDRLDARLIAAFTAMRADTRAAPDPRLRAFVDLLNFIEQAEEDMIRAKTRLEHQAEPRLRRQIEGDLVRAKARRDREILHLEKALRVHADLGRRLDLVRSVPGIGMRTALALVVAMPELGTLSREQAAALAGLAPFDRDSGKSHGTRHIAGGRARIRTALYAAALPASYRWNKSLVAMRERLTQRGKSHKQTMIACARKLLIYANTVVQRDTPWVTDA
jgi:transposase